MTETTAADNVCSPISKLSDVQLCIENPPKWVEKIVELSSRSNSVVKNTDYNCHERFDDFKLKERFDRSLIPKTLVCHDMKGGYLEDKFIDAVNVGNGYSFYRWAQIDIFVYFSHHLITIPPLCWINAAHVNGVKILGTFITEWNPGKEICNEIFASKESMQKFADRLVDICVKFKIEGWLLNIENPMEDTQLLREFVGYLSEQVHLKVPQGLVIWYDSVTIEGKLRWQNELNEHNSCYFDLCDGIFLNYVWNEKTLKKSVETAKHRNFDVFVGLDVFGRNCYGGGGFSSYLAAEKIREFNLSMAIFAQGWTYETLVNRPVETFFQRFMDRDNAFWRSIWNYLYTHPITKAFHTFFYIGTDTERFDLHSQHLQLSRALHSREELREDCTVSTLKGSCNCMQLHVEDRYTHCLITRQYLRPIENYVHHLFSCDISVEGEVIVYFYTKNLEATYRNDYLNLVLLIGNSNGTFRKIICYSIQQDRLIRNMTLLEVNPTKNQEIIDTVSCKYEKVPNDWTLRCYELQLNKCKILEIGAMIERNNTACLCGIGIKTAT